MLVNPGGLNVVVLDSSTSGKVVRNSCVGRELSPWVCAVAVVKTLAEIQEEEARAAAAAAEAAAPSATGTWAKALGKPSGASGPAWGIVSEADPDQRLRTGREILGPLGEPVAPQGITLGYVECWITRCGELGQIWRAERSVMSG